MAARDVIDAVAPAARRATFKASQLRVQSRQVEEFHTAAVQPGQELSVDLAFAPLARVDHDGVFPHLLGRKLTGEAIRRGHINPIRLQQRGKVRAHRATASLTAPVRIPT